MELFIFENSVSLDPKEGETNKDSYKKDYNHNDNDNYNYRKHTSSSERAPLPTIIEEEPFLELEKSED